MQDFMVVLVYLCIWEEFVAKIFSFFERTIAQGNYTVSAMLVIFKMILADSSSSNECDAGIENFGLGRKVVNFGSLNLGCALSGLSPYSVEFLVTELH